jgi:hypothetical protein
MAQKYPVRELNAAINKIIAPPVMPKFNNGIWSLPGSLYFCDRQMPFTLTPRAKLGIKRAIRNNKVFHIWLHPWNLLLYESLENDLKEILHTVALEREKGHLQVMTMGELADYLNCEGDIEKREKDNAYGNYR